MGLPANHERQPDRSGSLDRRHNLLGLRCSTGVDEMTIRALADTLSDNRDVWVPLATILAVLALLGL